MEPIEASSRLAVLGFMNSTGCYQVCTLMAPRCAFDLTLSIRVPARRDFGPLQGGSHSLKLRGLPAMTAAIYFENPFAPPEQGDRPFPRTISFFSTPGQLEVVIRRSQSSDAQPWR